MNTNIPRQIVIFDKDKKWAIAARMMLEQNKYIVNAETDSFDAFCLLLESTAYLVGIINLDSLDNIEAQVKRVHDQYPGCRWILTGSANSPEVDRLLRPPLQIADWFLNKSAFFPANLPELCDKLLQNALALPKTLEIILPDNFDELLEIYAHKTGFTGETNTGLRSSSKLIKEEFCINLGRMFRPDKDGEHLVARRIHVEPLAGSGSGSALLFKITPDLLIAARAPKSAVMKFDHREQISDEARHYDRFVEWFLTTDQAVRLIEHTEFSRFGAILYSFPRDVTSKYVDFAQFMREQPTQKSLGIIERMFAPDNKHWLAVDGNKYVPPRDQTLQLYYCTRVLQATPYEMRTKYFESQYQKYADNLSRKARVDPIVELSNGRMTFQLLNGEDIPDPFTYIQEPAVNQIQMSVIHGDLHAHNILIAEDEKNLHATNNLNAEDDKMLRYFFIDFFYTDFGHVFNDFVALEISARYDILMSRQLPSDQQTVVAEEDYKNAEKQPDAAEAIARLLKRDAEAVKRLLRLENAIIKKTIKNEEPRDPILTTDPHLAKVYQIVCAIRRLAFANFPDGAKSYYQAVVYRSLKMFKYWYPLAVRTFYLVMAGKYVSMLEGGEIPEDRQPIPQTSQP
jgi:cyanate lyase